MAASTSRRRGFPPSGWPPSSSSPSDAWVSRPDGPGPRSWGSLALLVVPRSRSAATSTRSATSSASSAAAASVSPCGCRPPVAGHPDRRRRRHPPGHGGAGPVRRAVAGADLQRVAAGVGRAQERANIEANLVTKRADVAVAQASSSPGCWAWQRRERRHQGGGHRRPQLVPDQLKGPSARSTFLAFLARRQHRGPHDGPRQSGQGGVINQLENSRRSTTPTTRRWPAPQAGVEPTLNAGLVALGVDFVKFPDPRGSRSSTARSWPGSFIDDNYLLGEIGAKNVTTNLSIIHLDRLLASTLPKETAKVPTDLLDGRAGEKLVDEVFVAGKTPAEQGVFDKRNHLPGHRRSSPRATTTGSRRPLWRSRSRQRHRQHPGRPLPQAVLRGPGLGRSGPWPWPPPPAAGWGRRCASWP